MVQMYEVKTYEALINLIKELQCETSEGSVYIYYTASKNGESWCPKCNNAWTVIQNSLNHLNPKAVFITAEVGNQKEWASKNNPFKSNTRFRVKVLPTLLHWKTYRKLEGDYCAKSDIVELLFDETEAT